MGSSRHRNKFRHDIMLFQRIIKFLALFLVYNLVRSSMEQNDRGVVFTGIVRRTGYHPLILVAFALGTDEGAFVSSAAHEIIDRIHGVNIGRGRPKRRRIDTATELGELPQGAHQVHRYGTGLAFFQATGCSDQTGEMSARRKSGHGDKRRIDFVFRCITTNKAHYGLKIMQLCRVNGIACRAVIRGNDRIARLGKGRTNRIQVGRTLLIVHAPGATVSVNHDRISILRFFGQVDIQCMEGLSVVRVIQVGKFFGILHFALALLTAKTLCKRRNRYREAGRRHHNLIHTQSFSKQAKCP